MTFLVNNYFKENMLSSPKQAASAYKSVFPVLAENIYHEPLCLVPTIIRMVGFFKQKLLNCIPGGC